MIYTIKKLSSLLLITIYWYSQSVFSHLAIMDSHHEIQDKSIQHVHKNNVGPQHIEKQSEWCKDIACEITCKNIEQAKVKISYWNIVTSFNNIIYYPNCILFSQKNINPTWKEPIFSSYALWPPISAQELMPRISVTVRII